MANVSKKIPSTTQPTWAADINGKRYEYPSGITTEVPEEVAALIDGLENSEGKPDPRASQRGIEKDVTQIVKDNFAGGVGYEETSEVVMLPETSFEVGKVPEILLSDSFPYTFETGKEYTITLDGETKTYTAELVEGIGPAIFSTNLEEVSGGNGWYIDAIDSHLEIVTLDTSLIGTHTIKIGYPTTTTHKIGSKYLPENEPLVLYAKQM